MNFLIIFTNLCKHFYLYFLLGNHQNRNINKKKTYKILDNNQRHKKFVLIFDFLYHIVTLKEQKYTMKTSTTRIDVFKLFFCAKIRYPIATYIIPTSAPAWN